MLQHWKLKTHSGGLESKPSSQQVVQPPKLSFAHAYRQMLMPKKSTSMRFWEDLGCRPKRHNSQLHFVALDSRRKFMFRTKPDRSCDSNSNSSKIKQLNKLKKMQQKRGQEFRPKFKQNDRQEKKPIDRQNFGPNSNKSNLPNWQHSIKLGLKQSLKQKD